MLRLVGWTANLETYFKLWNIHTTLSSLCVNSLLLLHQTALNRRGRIIDCGDLVEFFILCDHNPTHVEKTGEAS